MTHLRIEIEARGPNCGGCRYIYKSAGVIGPICLLFRDASGGGTVLDRSGKRCLPCITSQVDEEKSTRPPG